MRRRLEAVDHTVGKEDDRIGPAVVPAVVPAAGRTEIEADRIDQVAGHIESEVDRNAQPADRIEIEADQVSGHTGKEERQGGEGTVLAKGLRQACAMKIISRNQSVKRKMTHLLPGTGGAPGGGAYCCC